MSSSSDAEIVAGANAPKQQPPGPSPWMLPVGLWKSRKSLLRPFVDLQRQYGNFVQFGAEWRLGFLVNEPEYIREVLVTQAAHFEKDRALKLAKQVLGEGLLTSEGAFNRRQRKLVAPAFHRQRIAGYAEVMFRYAAATSARWRDGQALDMDLEMMRMTLGIVSKTLFDANVEDETDEISEAMDVVMKFFPRVANPLALFFLYMPFPSNFRFFAARRRLNETILRIIQERRAQGTDRGDLLSMLLAAQDEDDGSVMSDRQVRDEALTLFLAGHETTANALTWAFYLLSQHPECEARLHAELDTVNLETGDAMALFPQLPYTKQVISETLRLYPPAHLLARLALKDITLGPYTVPKDATIVMSPYIMHRDARFWPEPERFDPDRWLPEREATRPKFSYFPFGGGPRTCVGEQFAWMEAVLCLARLAKDWRARLAPGHPVDVHPLITLRPRHGMAMHLEKRQT